MDTKQIKIAVFVALFTMITLINTNDLFARGGGFGGHGGGFGGGHGSMGHGGYSHGGISHGAGSHGHHNGYGHGHHGHHGYGHHGHYYRPGYGWGYWGADGLWVGLALGAGLLAGSEYGCYEGQAYDPETGECVDMANENDDEFYEDEGQFSY